MPSISKCWLYILLFCQIHLLGQVAFFCGDHRVFLCTLSCTLRIMTVLLPPFQFGWILLFFLVWSLLLKVPVLCWVRDVKGGHPSLVPDLKGNTYRFCPLTLRLFVITSFIMFRYVPSIPTLLRLFMINGWWILSSAFSESIYMIRLQVVSTQ